MSIKANETGKCPHCWIPNRFESIAINTSTSNLWTYNNLYLKTWLKNQFNSKMDFCKCSDCWEAIIFFRNNMIYPLWYARWNAPKEVPTDIADDFNEACLVEPLSKKASAALARRCLQNMLRERGIKPQDLSKEIDEAMIQLPSHLSEAIDAIRNIGNFSAHPMKYQSTWDIVDVEDWETERILDTLEDLFDFYYIQPAKTQAKKATLNAKLTAAGKPPMK